LELLQGTLDLLILRTLIFGSQHGQGIARAIRERSQEKLLVEHGASTPHFNAWKSEAGSQQSGESLPTTVKRGSIP
jgi:hypothetical protein